MKSTARRNRRLRACAWAFLAALVPTAECWAYGDLALEVSPSAIATDDAQPAAPRLKKKRKSSARPVIPAPRKFTTEPTTAPQVDAAVVPASAVEAASTTSATSSSEAVPAIPSVVPPVPTPEPIPAVEPVPPIAPAPSVPSESAPAPVVETAPLPAAEPVPSTEPVPAAVELSVLKGLDEPAPQPMPAPAAPSDRVELPTGDPARIAAAAALLSSPPVEASPVQPPAQAQVEQPAVPAEQPSPLGEPAAAATAPATPAPTPEPSVLIPAAAPTPAAEATAPATPAPAASVPAQPTEAPKDQAAEKSAIRTDGGVKKTGCSTCGGFHSTLDGPAFHQSFGCANGQCVPGRKGPCAVPANECDTIVGNFISNLWQCLCCPDPCYEPQWVPAANASFFADYARPRTVTRLRFDRLMDMTHPDRNQFFLKMTNPNQASGLALPNSRHPNFSGKFYTDPSMNMSQMYLYQEAAAERASFFVEIPYRQINPLLSPTQAGFADMNLGSKALLFDCEMLQVTFQFRTYLPTGNAQYGLGTAHVSLDPSLLASLKLAPDTYFQAQVGNYIPLGGTSGIAGGMAYWFMSLNQVLAYITPDSPLIGTFEMDGWSFQNGGYTQSFIPTGSRAVNPYTHSGDSYFNIGPGLRQSICNKVDFGGAITWATTQNHWADPWFRLEMRFLF